ncbi:MAG TPA: hypothetical protein EYP33_04565 [Pyrodictium sp.]|nr:hypothetical protein [Pyrodictium sp.]
MPIPLISGLLAALAPVPYGSLKLLRRCSRGADDLLSGFGTFAGVILLLSVMLGVALHAAATAK